MDQSADEIRAEIEGTRDHLGGTLDAIGDRISPSRIVQRRKNSVVAGVQSVRERVMGTAHDTQQNVSTTASDALDSIKDVPGAVKQRTQGTPLVAGAIAFGIGFLVAAAFPASKSEQGATSQLLDKLEPVKEELTATAQEVADHLKQPAIDAAQAVKASATEAAGHVTDAAKDAVDDTKQQAAESVSNVKDGSSASS